MGIDRRTRRRTTPILALLLLLSTIGLHAGTADWDALDAGTKSLLSPWSDGWETLSASERERLVANAGRWQLMDAPTRAAFLKRSAQWQALPPSERAQLRARYAALQALSVDDRARVHAGASRFATLPAPQQGLLRARFAAQEASQQTAWLLGPSIGSWIEQAQTLFTFVPDGERGATLKMLQTLPAATRAQLFTLAGRLSPDQREQLRKQLLGADPARRAGLVDQRVLQ